MVEGIMCVKSTPCSRSKQWTGFFYVMCLANLNSQCLQFHAKNQFRFSKWQRLAQPSRGAPPNCSQFMAIICRKYKLLFIMTPRTACTAIGELLCDHYEWRIFAWGRYSRSPRIYIRSEEAQHTIAELLAHNLLTRASRQNRCSKWRLCGIHSIVWSRCTLSSVLSISRCLLIHLPGCIVCPVTPRA